jgi:hypothetical protein
VSRSAPSSYDPLKSIQPPWRPAPHAELASGFLPLTHKEEHLCPTTRRCPPPTACRSWSNGRHNRIPPAVSRAEVMFQVRPAHVEKLSLPQTLSS